LPLFCAQSPKTVFVPAIKADGRVCRSLSLFSTCQFGDSRHFILLIISSLIPFQAPWSARAAQGARSQRERAEQYSDAVHIGKHHSFSLFFFCRQGKRKKEEEIAHF
jgi:hypothetical protein